MKAEEDVKEIQESINRRLGKELEEKVEIPNKDRERKKDLQDFQEKYDNSVEDLKYVGKNNNLYVKNVKYADERIKTLKDNLEELKTQKYLLTNVKEKIKEKTKNCEAELKRIYPEFDKFMAELDSGMNEEDGENSIKIERNSQSIISTSAINEVREKIRRGEITLENREMNYLKPEEVKKPRVIDLEEDKKRQDKLERLHKEQEDTLIEERESEYYGSQISKGGAMSNNRPRSKSGMSQLSESRPSKFADAESEKGSSKKSKNKGKNKNKEDCIIF